MNRKSRERNRKIIRYNMIGIVMNLFLAVFKITAGLAVHAHAVMLDGVNSLSDMISSLISILSAYIAGRRGSSTHPLGYGRLEYISSFIVTVIIMYIGAKTLIETIMSIIHPHDAPHYGTTVIVIMTVSLVCKILYGLLMRRRGRELDSAGMVMTGTDSLGDALISLAILAAIVIYRVTGVDIEHYLCIFIALMIIRTGVEMIRDCIDKMLGTRLSDEDRRMIISIAAEFDEVLNVSNLMIHSYGEECYVGSLDIEVDEEMTAVEISRLTRSIIRRAAEKGVILTSVGVCATNTTDPEVIKAWDDIIAAAGKHDGVKRVHSFMADFEENYMSFAVVPDYSVEDRDDSIAVFIEEIESLYPDMRIEILKEIDM